MAVDDVVDVMGGAALSPAPPRVQRGRDQHHARPALVGTIQRGRLQAVGQIGRHDELGVRLGLVRPVEVADQPDDARPIEAHR